MKNNSKLEAAHQLLREGYSVIPVKNKKPLVSWKQFQERRPTEDEINTWWTNWADAGVAIVCGNISRGLAVIDIDDLEFSKRIKNSSLVQKTKTVETPSGGLHLYFFNTTLDSKTKPLPGVGDFKSEGSYVVCPPTPGYQVLSNVPIQIINGVSDTADRFLSYWSQKNSIVSLKKESKGVATGTLIVPGTRQTTLTSIGGFLRNKGLSQESIEAALLVINESACTPPLSPNEIASISKSMGRYPSGKCDPGTPTECSVPKWDNAKNLAEQEQEEIEWLWYGYMPLSSIVLLVRTKP